MPSGHVYVRHLASLSRLGPVRLPDPPPPGLRSGEQRWWPPVMLDADWVRTHDFDVMHLNFGFDAMSPETLLGVVDAVHDTGRRFAYTVHDLRNPHHSDRTAHDEQLDALVPAVDAVLTLTEGAADEVERRWGRRPRVVPHPHVVELDRMVRSARSRSLRAPQQFRVGLHAKSVRPSMAPGRLLPVLVDTVADLDEAVLQVNVHRDVMAGGARHDVDLARALVHHAERGELELHVHDFLPDEELWRYLESLDVSVLPYRFGTHSGWLEACRDLGTTVVAPSCGYYADQGPVLTYVHDEDAFDPGSLAQALRTAHADRPQWGADVEQRRAQREAVAQAHDLLYAELAP